MVVGLAVGASLGNVWLRVAKAEVPLAAMSSAAPNAGELTRVVADGRVDVYPGRKVTLIAELGGRAVSVNVVEGARVRKGDVLARFDDAVQRAALQEAVGASSEAFARMRARREELRRTKSLVATGALAPASGRQALEEKQAAQARLHSSGGAIANARAMVERTRVVAPIDGVVLARHFEPGETLAPGAPLFLIADLAARRIEAEVDEFDAARISIGMSAEVRADGLPDVAYAGTVEAIPDVVAPRKLRPQDPARPTDSWVLSVKVSLPPDAALKLGQRVSVSFLASRGGS